MKAADEPKPKKQRNASAPKKKPEPVIDLVDDPVDRCELDGFFKMLEKDVGLYQFDKAAFESSTSTHHRHRLPSTDAPRARLSSFSEPL